MLHPLVLLTVCDKERFGLPLQLLCEPCRHLFWRRLGLAVNHPGDYVLHHVGREVVEVVPGKSFHINYSFHQPLFLWWLPGWVTRHGSPEATGGPGASRWSAEGRFKQEMPAGYGGLWKWDLEVVGWSLQCGEGEELRLFFGPLDMEGARSAPQNKKPGRGRAGQVSTYEFGSGYMRRMPVSLPAAVAGCSQPPIASSFALSDFQMIA